MKTTIIISIITLLVNFYSLQAQNVKLSPNMMLGNRKVEVQGVLNYKDKNFGEYFYDVQKDKIVLWQNWSGYGLIKTTINMEDIASLEDEGISIVEGTFDDNGKKLTTYSVWIKLKEEKTTSQVVYRQDEDLEGDKGAFASILFMNKKEAQALETKLKKEVYK
jgi:hypothetical protein